MTTADVPSSINPDADFTDADALVARVAELERTQLEEDVDGFLALLDPRATWVTAGGVRFAGREPIAEFTRKVLPGAFADGSSVSYRVQIVSPLAPGVAVTAVNQQYVDVNGRPTSAGKPTYVWRRVNGEWLIIVGQNTGVAGSDGQE
ncbi:MAG: SgcJ/EcaC family oxidoreductase [Micromonosporaceae bacterium]